MQRKILWNKPIVMKKLLNDLVIFSPKTNISRILDMQIGQKLKASFWRSQQVVGHT